MMMLLLLGLACTQTGAVVVGGGGPGGTAGSAAVRFFPVEGGGFGVAPLGDIGWRQPAPLQLEVAGQEQEVGDHLTPCQATLDRLCGVIRTVMKSCDACVGQHQSDLRAAGCGSSDVSDYCKTGSKVSTWLRASYASVATNAAEGTVVSTRGSHFHVADRFSAAAAGGFSVQRTVTVLAAGEGDVGFSSRFSLVSDAAAKLTEFEFFMPGIWYRNSQALAPGKALAGDLGAPAILVREDRLPLPMVMLREPASGATLTLAHRKPNGSSFAGEDFAKRIVDPRMQFGSVGVLAGAGSTPAGRPELAFQFPGSEGSRTYICCHADWANRSHPVLVGFEHSYELRLSPAVAPPDGGGTYSTAVLASWREAFAEANPQPPELTPADMDLVYQSSISLLSAVSLDYHGTPVVPFAAAIPNGSVIDTSSQMGFVGKATLAAALMLRDALKGAGGPTSAAAAATQHAEAASAVVDVWVKNAMTPSGVLKTWFNTCQASPHDHGGRCPPGAAVSGPLQWRSDSPYGGHLRIMSDGALGVLDAWRLMQHRKEGGGDPKPEWLAFARKHGDFLVRVQAADGSIAGEWAWNGTVTGNFTNVSDHPIPLLLALHNATGDAKYLDAARDAGRFSATQMAASFAYIGGACDNPNVLDKEAGALALRAFVALYDATDDRSWIAPAEQAALFIETWTYAWAVPLNKDDAEAIYPTSRTTLGVSLIATGQSGADNFMAEAVYDFWRLYTITRDDHYRRYALFLQDATKQVMDFDGSLGYAHRGLMNEAMKLAPPRGHGVSKWLPWLSVVILEPMVRLEERWGSYDLRKLM
jgi:hypothetical protein